MPSIETSIWLALKSRLKALTLNPALPIAWPNESFNRPPTGYLRATWIPNTTRRMLIGAGPHQRLGILQVDVMAKKNQDIAVATEIAGKVASHFPADLCMRSHGVAARVTRAPEIAQPIAEDSHLMVPVTIRVESYA